MRPDHDVYFLALARLVASRSTCRRRRVGCVLTDPAGRVLATGYNGGPSGMPHCLDQPCPGSYDSPGQGLAGCEAVHAEQNAVLQCRDPTRIWSVYSTTAPCHSCAKLLLNTPAQRLVFLDPYPHEHAERWWRRAQREWRPSPELEDRVRELLRRTALFPDD